MVDSVQVFPPGFRVTDAAGNPVSNAKIKFKNVGPGAPRTVYALADLSAPSALGDTVRTRSDGQPVSGGSTVTLIYISSVAYHIEITDEFDVVIFPAQDNVKGAVDTSTFLVVGSTSTLNVPVVNETGNFTLGAAYKGKLVNCNPSGGAFTATLDAAATLGDGWSVTLRNGGTANQVKIAASQNIETPMGVVTAFALRVGESCKIVCSGGDFKAIDFTPPLLTGTIGIIEIADRITAAPGAPTPGARYIVTAGFDTFEAEDIIEANGQGGFFEITPPANCGWLAYVQDEQKVYQFRGSAWLELDVVATQAEMEAASAVDRIATPGRLHFHPGVTKFWAKFGVTGNLLASYNVDSITDNGTGSATVNIGTDFSSADWCCHVNTIAGATGGSSVSSQAAGSVTVISWNSATGAALDPTAWFVSGKGDQA